MSEEVEMKELGPRSARVDNDDKKEATVAEIVDPPNVEGNNDDNREDKQNDETEKPAEVEVPFLQRDNNIPVQRSNYDEIEELPLPLRKKRVVFGKLLDDEIIVEKEEIPGGITVILPKRWIMIILVFLISFSNTCSWIAYASVGNYVNGFYGEATSTWISMVFLLMALPFSFVSMLIGSITKVKFALYLAGLLNFGGALFRWASSISAFGTDIRFYLIMIGQSIAGSSYTFLLYLPSKVSDTWFPPSQRTIATTIGVMANPAGVMAANLISPLLVQSSRDVWILNMVLVLLSAVAMFAVHFGTSEERTEENQRTDLEQKTYAESMHTCFKSKTYIILLISLGGGIAMFNSLYTMMSQMICPSGHGNNWAGYYAVSMIVAGIIGATVASRIIDIYTCYKEVMIICMIAASTFGIGFLWMTRVEGPVGRVSLLILAILLGAFGLAAYPVGLELAMECVYPVSPEVSSGHIVLMGQAMSIILVYVLKQFATKISLDDSVNSVEVCRINSSDSINIPKDFFVPIVIISVMAAFLAFIILFIDSDYLRAAHDKKKRFNISDAEANQLLDTIAKSTDTTLIDPPEKTPKKKRIRYLSS